MSGFSYKFFVTATSARVTTRNITTGSTTTKDFNLMNLEDDVRVVVQSAGVQSAGVQIAGDILDELCPVCCGELYQYSSNFSRNACCARGIHTTCQEEILLSSLNAKQKGSCPHCRTRYPDGGSHEEIDQVQRWVEQGESWAQVFLAQKYLLGHPKLPKNYKRAAGLYQAAADQGNRTAQFNLAIMYESGIGVKKSNERAKDYFELSALQNHAGAQFKMGSYYAEGEGVAKSNEAAREWWTKAAQQGNETAIEALKILDHNEGRMTDELQRKIIETLRKQSTSDDGRPVYAILQGR